MKKFIFYFLLSFLFSITTMLGQTNPWKSVRAKNISQQNEVLSRPNMPKQFQVLNLDTKLLKKETNKAKSINYSSKQRAAGVLINMPTPDGDFITFEVFEKHDLAPELAKKFPNLKSYTGYNPYHKATEINFTINALGFNGIITSPNFPTIYIDSYSKDLEQYIIYYRTELDAKKTMNCLDKTVINEEEIKKISRRPAQKTTERVLRNYKLAIATTSEYSQFHINRVGAQNKNDYEKKEIVLSAIQTTVNRVNSVYKRDLAIIFTLVADNDKIIFLTPNGFDNNDADSLIEQSQEVIDATIGFSNYDIGHTFSTGAGGLAAAGVCSPYKAMGVTGSQQPVNDPYDIDYVCHEIGHQFGASHTFNNSCKYNREAETAFEPGSGSTIMAYAGICEPNVTTNSDDLFHFVSIEQIMFFVEDFATCSTNTTLTNTAPEIDNLPNYVIPKGTSFKLKATATDSDNDVLTYTWDQLDSEPTPRDIASTNTGGPLFKSLKPTEANVRYFPNYQSVLEGNLAPAWEVIPTVARTLTFGLTVRDNNPKGGLVSLAETTIQVANTGPFTITNIDEQTSWSAGENQNVTWDVAGTNENGINVATVNILLSTDGGLTYEMLKENTPNDGSEEVIVPNTSSKETRVMIEANNNIFYTVSKPFSIGHQLIVESFCKDYTLTYNESDITNMNTSYKFVFNVNEAEDFEIKDMKLTTNITLPRASDVNVHFINPNESENNRRIVFRNLACNTSGNLNATFQNSGAVIACDLIGSNTILKPVEDFTAVNNLNANGAWTVSVSKNSTAPVKVNKLILTLCGERRTYLDPNTKTEPFAIYPNPSNGIFNFYFDTKNDVKVSVFDMTGRLVYNKTYSSENTNAHNVNIAMLAKGVYIFKAEDGKSKHTKKIIIN